MKPGAGLRTDTVGCEIQLDQVWNERLFVFVLVISIFLGDLIFVVGKLLILKFNTLEERIKFTAENGKEQPVKSKPNFTNVYWYYNKD